MFVQKTVALPPSAKYLTYHRTPTLLNYRLFKSWDSKFLLNPNPLSGIVVFSNIFGDPLFPLITKAWKKDFMSHDFIYVW